MIENMVATTSTSVLADLLGPFVESMTPDDAKRLADLRADEATTRRIETLAHKANEGELTPDERREYAAYVDAIDVIAVMQAKARAVLRQNGTD